MKIIVAASPANGGLLLASRIFSTAGWIADYIRVLAVHHAAAAKYVHLSRLSDAELHRRGLSRANLARHVLATCDRPTLG